MTEQDPIACGLFVTPQDQDNFKMSSFSNIRDNLTDEEADHYEALMEGIGYMVQNNPYFFVTLGTMLIEQSEMDIAFEPADELEEAIAESKIIPFNRKN